RYRSDALGVTPPVRRDRDKPRRTPNRLPDRRWRSGGLGHEPAARVAVGSGRGSDRSGRWVGDRTVATVAGQATTDAALLKSGRESERYHRGTRVKGPCSKPAAGLFSNLKQ